MTQDRFGSPRPGDASRLRTWASVAGGLGLMALAARRGATGRRLLIGLAGALLASRGLVGRRPALSLAARRARPGDVAASAGRTVAGPPPPDQAAARTDGHERRNPGDIFDSPGNIVDEASEESFPASDPPAYYALQVGNHDSVVADRSTRSAPAAPRRSGAAGEDGGAGRRDA